MRYTFSMALLFLCGVLVCLFLLSRRLTRLISHLLIQFFHNQSVSIYSMSFLFLPGVVVHELSHLLVANLLLVTTGEVEFFPEIQGNEVKMGSVAIARTDPFRRFLIGVAPLLGGIGIMLLASVYLPSTLLSWQSVLLFYIIFEIANTMFSSNKDMEGAIGFLIGVVVLGLVLQLIGLPVFVSIVSFSQAPFITALAMRLTIFLLLAIGLDIFFILLLEGLLRLRR